MRYVSKSEGFVVGPIVLALGMGTLGCAGETGGPGPASAALEEDPPPYYDECSTNEDCGDEGYCEFGGWGGDACGLDGAPGGCLEYPAECEDVYEPVCGCDNVTYSNSCYAALAGVSVASEGACEGGACGGPTNIPCPAGEYCNYDPSQSCGSTGETGTCLAMPPACQAYWDPVCGCDGQTYSNACYAAEAGVSVEHEGACCTGLSCL